MKVTCSKDELVSALGVVSRAVSTRTSVQIRIPAQADRDRIGADFVFGRTAAVPFRPQSVVKRGEGLGEREQRPYFRFLELGRTRNRKRT